ncbi:nephrin-like [Ornithodoros turicata]|uniref:nephrin-like n=1 Tax=Ornithodoros turicata TaxID=34597 RepID=UPI003138D25A
MLLRICAFLAWITGCLAPAVLNHDVKVYRREEGEEVSLPCDIESERDDGTASVRWFREGATAPFYVTEDADGRGIWNARHDIGVPWVGRAVFHTLRSPARFVLSQLRATDSGVYRCVVRFHSGAIRNITVASLIVGVRPSRPVIKDLEGNVLEGKTRPLLLGSRLELDCLVEKGKPAPTVTWYRDEQILDFPSEPLLDEGARSKLIFSGLNRTDLQANLSCRARNPIALAPINVSIILDLIMPPLSVTLENQMPSYDSGVSTEFRCRVVGSRPKPEVTWTLSGRKPEGTYFVDVSDDENVTKSVLLTVLAAGDNRQSITCGATNPSIPDVQWKDSMELNVLHPPVLALNLGNGLREDHILEGRDVYMECDIVANPQVNDIWWTFEGEDMPVNDTGIFVNGQYLVLRNVTQGSSGAYRCHARNLRGASESGVLTLRVKYSPRCKSADSVPRSILHRYWSAGEEVKVSCEVDSDPPEVTFRWTVRNNSESRELSDFVSNGTRSVVRYFPTTATEYVTLTCWANNSVGMQQSYCTFFVEPQGVPKAHSQCAVVNQATSWFVLECAQRPGERAWYQLEVYHADTGRLLSNASSLVGERPHFRVRNIPPATECLARVYVVNERGRSEPTTIVVRAIPPPSKLLTSGVQCVDSNHTLAALILLLCSIYRVCTEINTQGIFWHIQWAS